MFEFNSEEILGSIHRYQYKTGLKPSFLVVSDSVYHIIKDDKVNFIPSREHKNPRIGDTYMNVRIAIRANSYDDSWMVV